MMQQTANLVTFGAFITTGRVVSVMIVNIKPGGKVHAFPDAQKELDYRWGIFYKACFKTFALIEL